MTRTKREALSLTTGTADWRSLPLTTVLGMDIASVTSSSSAITVVASRSANRAPTITTTTTHLDRTCEACYDREHACTGTAPHCQYCSDHGLACDYSANLPTMSMRTIPAWQFPASISSKKPHTHTVPAAHGHAFLVSAGSRFRIIDLHGSQVVDFMAWCTPFKTSKEHLSMSYTRHALGGSAPPQVGECLYTNRDEPIFKLTADPVKTHDMLYMACNPGFYKRLGQEGHRSCATNVAEAMKPFGMESWLEVTDPFNIFQNTPYYALKALNCSRAGDYVEFEALKDAVCAVSSCPFDSDGFNGGKVTEVAVVTGIVP